MTVSLAPYPVHSAGFGRPPDPLAATAFLHQLPSVGVQGRGEGGRDTLTPGWPVSQLQSLKYNHISRIILRTLTVFLLHVQGLRITLREDRKQKTLQLPCTLALRSAGGQVWFKV